MRWALRAFAVLGLVACSLSASAVAEAGSYTVHVCDGASGNRVNAIAFGANGSNAAYPACPTDGSGHRIGIATHSAINGGTTGWLTSGWATFSAPGGTTISSVSGHLAGRGTQGFSSLLQSSSDNFASQLTALADCAMSFCPLAGPDGGVPINISTPGATALRLVTVCLLSGGCSTASTSSWPYAPGWASMGDMQVTINDGSLPSLHSVRGNAWAASSWHRGVEPIGFGASDNTGIQRTYVQVDGGGYVTNRPNACDYTFAVPCPNSSIDDVVDTASLSDGHHSLTLAAQDAAGNWNATTASFDVDNHSPDNAAGVTVVGGENSWHNTNSFDVSWTNPDGQTSPIAAVHYTIYDASGNAVGSGTRSGTGVTSLTGLAVPAQGDYTLKVYLEDAAGNTNPATASDPVHLKYDDVPPGSAAPQHRNGWVDSAHASGYVQRIHPPQGTEGVPVSGIGGYAISADGSSPGASADVAADRMYEAEAPIEDLHEGTMHFKARAISGAGVSSAKVGTEDIHVDLSSPTVELAGEVGSAEWSRDPVVVRITATDPGRLSGMAGAEALDTNDLNGAYISYAVDGGGETRVRGPATAVDPSGIRGYADQAATSVTVADDGRHTVSYSATDAAGNESPKRTVSLKLDRTAPELVVFEAQSADDPRLVNVAAADVTSGLADGGKIQLRRLNGGDWITLRTSREGSRYYAHIDNTELPEADYEFRASIPDQAGNVAVGDRNRTGNKQVLHIDPTHIGPYRTGLDVGSVEAADQGATVETRITARVVVHTKASAKKCRKVQGKKQQRCRKIKKRARTRLVKSARIGFGKRAVIKGKATTADGHPLTGIELTVLAKPSSDGSRYLAEHALRTDRAGAFSYTAKAGPSRILDFAYRGNSTYKHADGYATLKVPAAASIHASRKHVKNGRSVGFKGKLPGKPYPTKGKVVDLQAFYRHKWRTFATARASRRGAWKFQYRFEATRGTVVYPFRVRVRASSDYAYELGYSRTVKVTVSG